MDRELCSITWNHPLDVRSGGSIAYKKNCCEGKVTEEFCLKCNKKISGVAEGVYASENGAVQYYSEDYCLGNKCTKVEEWFTS